MDNKDFPQQEDGFFPEETGSIPADTTAPEDMSPLIEELSFVHEPEKEPSAPAETAILSEEAPVEEVPSEEAVSSEEALPQEEDTPVWATPNFMEQIPDVAEDYPPEVPPEYGQSPEVPEEPVFFPENTIQEPPLSSVFDSIAPDVVPEDVPEIVPEIVPESIPETVPEDLPEPAPAEVANETQPDSSNVPEEMPAASPEKPKSPPRHRPLRKGRPKRKKGEGLFGIPNILVTVVWLALILAIGVTAGRMLWVCAADVLAFGREDKPVTITIYEADDMASITDKLYNAGLIRYKSLFSLYASISDAEEDIQPGIYDLNTRYDYHALVNFMSPRSSREVVELTIPEGYTCRQIFQLLEENRICTAVDAAAYAANGELNDYWFLEGLERGDEYCLEGYLFPDTYEFYKNSTPREALQRMLNNFEAKFTEEMRLQLDNLNANVTGGGYTVREFTIVASLIEKESAAPAESAKIAGVIYNRLHNWGETPAYLNIDAAIVYAQDGEAETINTGLDSPYNTYTHTGLTPTPIANPGLSSLQAALNPESHNYYYYVLNPATGMHQFSTTQEEHNANIAQFYNS